MHHPYVRTTWIELHPGHDVLDRTKEMGDVSLHTFVFLYNFEKCAQDINEIQVFIKFHFLFAFVKAYLVVSHKCFISMEEDCVSSSGMKYQLCTHSHVDSILSLINCQIQEREKTTVKI